MRIPRRAAPVCLASLSCLVLAAGPATAIEIVRDDRSVVAEGYYFVDASWGYDEYSYPLSASASGPFFDETLQDESSWDSPGGLLEGSATASQTSTVGSGAIVASGSAFGQGETFSGSGGDPDDVGSFWWEFSEASGRAESVLDVLFSVDTVTYYFLSGSVGASGGSFHLMLEGFTPDPLDLLFQDDATISAYGVLLPGYSYRLFAEADADALGGGTASVDYDFAFTVPEPGSLALLGSGLGLLASARRRL